MRTLTTLVVAGCASACSIPALAQVAPLRITQVYAGAGQTTAPYSRDYVEIFNYGPVPVDLSSFSIQAQPGITGGFWTTRTLSGTINPGSFFLISCSPTETLGMSDLSVPPDYVTTGFNLNLLTGSGKVALVYGATQLDGCPEDFAAAGIVDMVGYGDGEDTDLANCFEGAPATLLTEVISAYRINPCVDTNNNANDFTFDAPNPRNSQTPAVTCTPIAGADLQLMPLLPNNCFDVGGVITYVFTILNNGPDAASNVQVTVNLPSENVEFRESFPPLTPSGSTLTYSIGSMNAHDFQTLVINMNVTGAGTIPGVSAQLTTTSADFASYNNTGTLGTATAMAAPTTPTPLPAIFNTRAGVASDLPGVSGVHLGNNTNRPRLRPFYSADRSRWIVVVDTDSSGGNFNNDEALLVGNGTSFVTAARENVTTLPSGRNVVSFGSTQGINNAGHYVFHGTQAPPSQTDQIIVKDVGSGLVTVANEGSPIPNLTASNYGSTLGSVSMQDNGTTTYFARMTGFSGTQATAIFSNDGNIKRAQQGVDIPSGQLSQALAPTSFTYSFFDSDLVSASNSGTWGAPAGINSAFQVDRIFAVNNGVVVQENIPFAGLPGTTAENVPFNYAFVDADGNWYSYGSQNSGQDWAARNGVVIAKSGDLIHPGSPFTWSDSVNTGTFFLATGSANGSYVVGGYTSNTDTGADTVLVYNNSRIMAREGDPIDLNGNNIDDDDAYIMSIHPDSAALSNDGWLYFTADLQTRANRCALGTTTSGHAFVRVKAPCRADFNAVNGVTVQDIFDFLTAWLAGSNTADFNGVNGVTVQDIFDFLTAWLAGC